MAKTKICDGYIDYLGNNANYYQTAVAGYHYLDTLHCTLMNVPYDQRQSFLASADTFTTISQYSQFDATVCTYTDGNGTTCSARYKLNALPSVATESDVETDDVDCYEELFNHSVSSYFAESPWFSPTWNSFSSTVQVDYDTMNTAYSTNKYAHSYTTTYGNYQQMAYLSNKNISSGYEATAYDVYDITTTPIVHDTSKLLVPDITFTAVNKYCFNLAVFTLSYPNVTAFGSEIPIAYTLFDRDMYLSTSAFTIEHSDLGLVSVV